MTTEQETIDLFHRTVSELDAQMVEENRIGSAIARRTNRIIRGVLILDLRIGLHAGPVYTGLHPLTERPIVYGSHVSRTARIEPVTVPGHVYASQQFVALLTAEETAFRAEQGVHEPWYACEYLGVLQLAKHYGNWPVYHLLPVSEAA